MTFPLVLLLLDGRRRWRPAAAMLAMSLMAGLRAIAATAATPGAGAGFASTVSAVAYVKAQSAVIAFRSDLKATRT